MDDTTLDRLAQRVAEAVVAALRDADIANDAPAPIAGDEAFAVDIASHEVVLNGRRVRVKPREFALLAVLAKRPGRVFSRDELLAAAWPDEVAISVADRTVDVHVARLRRRIGRCRIRTVAGVGYALEPSA